MTFTTATVPILGMYQTNGAFPVPGPSAWPSGPTTNMSATYMAWGQDIPTYVTPFIAECNSNGMTAYVELEPWNSGESWNEDVEFSTITGGTWDSWLEEIGTVIATAAQPCILTFAHEFNVSGQYPWSQGDTGDGPSGGAVTPAEWITTWEYVRAKVNSTAGGYALWMWACSAWTAGTTIDPSPWWPGSEYVDMVGIDGYPSTEYDSPGQTPSLGTFAGQIQQTVTAIRNLGWTDPIFISETNLAQMENGPPGFPPGESIADFVADMYTAGISGILEFEDATWDLPQMTGEQWEEYNNAIAANYGTGGGGEEGGGGTPTYTQTLIDDFSSGSSLNPDLWITPDDTNGISISDGSLIIEGISNDEQVAVVKSLDYNLADGIFGLQLSQAGTEADGTMWFLGIADGNDPLGNYYEFQTFPIDSSWYAWAGTGATVSDQLGNQDILSPSVWTNGDWLALGNYNLNGSGDVHVYSSPDAVTWTEIASWDVTGAINEGAVCFYFGTNYNPDTGTSNYVATIDNVSWFTRGESSGGGSPPPSSGAFTPAGSFIEATEASFTWQPAAAGNTLVVIAFSEDAGDPVTAMSSTNATWEQVVPDQTLGTETVTEATAFLGTATSTSRETVTLTTAAASGDLRVLAQEFSSGGALVALDTFATMDADASGEVTAWPSVTPGRGGGELLFGFERNIGDGGGTAVAGSTSGVTYTVDANGNGGAYDTDVSAATAVAWTDSDSRTALVLLLYAGSGGGESGASSGLLMVGIA